MKYFQKIMRQDKERFTVPRSVQQTIPIQRIWQDGLFYSGSRYSQAWRFSDINYLLSGRAEKEQKFHIYSALLNAQKSGCYAQITICNHSLDRKRFAASVLLPEREDSRGRYRVLWGTFPAWVPGANPWTPDSGLRPFAPSSSRIPLPRPSIVWTP